MTVASVINKALDTPRRLPIHFNQHSRHASAPACATLAAFLWRRGSAVPSVAMIRYGKRTSNYGEFATIARPPGLKLAQPLNHRRSMRPKS